MRFHDPRAETAVESEPYELSAELGAGMKVAFLANGFPDSEPFLNLVAQALEAQFSIDSAHWNKGNASITAPPEMLADIQANCQAAIAAYGH